MTGKSLLACGCGKPLDECGACAAPPPVFHDGVWDYTGHDSYVANFSQQWDRHRFTQVDSAGFVGGYDGEPNSRGSFIAKSQIKPDTLAGQVVLDAGCGVGRYAEIVAPHAGFLICVDLSDAVFHCASLLVRQGFQNVVCVRADLAALPILDGVVDTAFSIGVIHHTAEPPAVAARIFRALKPGGLFSAWLYAEQPAYRSPSRAKIREFTTDPGNFEWVWRLAELAPMLRNLYREDKNARFDFVREVMGISTSRNDTECVLDTFDWLTAKYQYQYTNKTAAEMAKGAGFSDIRVGRFPVSFTGTKRG